VTSKPKALSSISSTNLPSPLPSPHQEKERRKRKLIQKNNPYKIKEKPLEGPTEIDSYHDYEQHNHSPLRPSSQK
jgi:hypothetical protein